jgi:diaminopimelate decarboxylase
VTNLNWQILDEISEKQGDSFYLIDLEKFQQNYQQFLDAFRVVYPKTQLAYSYKTNYTPRLCQIVQTMGGYAEVVSGMEYELALRVGVPAERIIFNGPYKQQADFEKALLSGSIVNLDASYEVKWVSELARKFPDTTLRIGIRCNFSITNTPVSRFGFDVETDDFQTIIQTLQSISNCKIVGLHCHFLAEQRSVAVYELITQKMVDIAATKFSDVTLEFIDLGGGFFSPMNQALKKQFLHPIPSFSEYGKGIATIFKTLFPNNTGPELILEPGISITANAMKFVSKVIDVKSVKTQHFALVAGSRYDIKPTLSQRNLPMMVISEHAETSKNGLFDIVGSTCMEGDFLYTGYQGEVRANDYVVFDNVGAYTNVLRPPFINPAPAILSLTSSGKVEVIRRSETIDDIFSGYIF